MILFLSHQQPLPEYNKEFFLIRSPIHWGDHPAAGIQIIDDPVRL